MPQFAHRHDADKTFSEAERVIVRVLMDEINTLRQGLSLPLRTPPQIRTAIQQALVTLRRQDNTQEGGDD